MSNKKYKNRTLNEVREQAEYAAETGRCVTVSPAWLIALLDGAEALARLANERPQFYNPLDAFKAQEFRDYVLKQREIRKSYGGTVSCAAPAGR